MSWTPVPPWVFVFLLLLWSLARSSVCSCDPANTAVPAVLPYCAMLMLDVFPRYAGSGMVSFG